MDAESQEVFEYWKANAANAVPLTTGPVDSALVEHAMEMMKGSGGGGDIRLRGRSLSGALVMEGPWNQGGLILEASGRLLFQRGGENYVCSATAIDCGMKGRSLILTAAHCLNVSTVPSVER
jgi:hypothetical protein